MLWLLEKYYVNAPAVEAAVLCPPLMTDAEPYTATACTGGAAYPPNMQQTTAYLVNESGNFLVDENGNYLLSEDT